MNRFWSFTIMALVLLALGIDHNHGASNSPPSQEATPPARADPSPAQESRNQNPIYRLDFSDYQGGSVGTWLESKGFRLEEAAKHANELKLSVQDGRLILEAQERLRGFVYKDSLEIKDFSKVRLEWGVLKYPEGASYEKQLRNEALMVYISFGHEKTPSGLFVLPDAPYFIGLFLCKDDKLRTPYIGKYYQEGGRFVCLAHAEPQQDVISEFDLPTAFRSYFEKSEVPPISGINLGVDTSDAGDGGKAAAYIKSIEFLP
jgi:hypothetical protein